MTLKTISDIASAISRGGYAVLSADAFREMFRTGDREIRITGPALDRAIKDIKSEMHVGFLYDIEATYVSGRISNEKSLSQSVHAGLTPTVIFVLQSHAFIKSSRR